MRFYTQALTLAAASFMAALTSPAATPEVRATAKQLVDAHKEAIVWLSVLSKTTLSAEGDAPPQVQAALAGQSQENKSETTGTMVDASGLIVTALGGLDKSSLVDGQSVNTPMGTIKLKANSEIKEVKVITADGSELPADLVLKDEDLGLAFVRIRMDSDEAKGVELKAIDLADSAPGELLDDCIALGRLDESLNRETSVSTSEISGITTKPRTFYRVATDVVGCPVYLASGKLLGLSVIRKPRTSTPMDANTSVGTVILPAAEVAKIAAQAKEAPTAPTPADDEGVKEENPTEEKADNDKPAQ
ncbi:MAG: serine protease [Verrucomicrobiales bacterium]